MSKKTLVLGASTKPDRYSYKAATLLLEKGHEILLVGLRKGYVEGHEITVGLPGTVDELHTVTLYLNPERQKNYYQDILNLKPKRILFNPGTENHEFSALAKNAGIKTESACTLVLLRLGSY